ncbi:hypothetical protein D3C87_1826690 [compost metagenome]
MFLVRFRNPYTIVFYGNDALLVVDLGIEFDKGMFTGILDGIGDQVDHTVPDEVLIQVNHTFQTCMLVNDVLLLFGNHLHFFGYLFRKFHQVEGRKSRFYNTCFQSFKG